MGRKRLPTPAIDKETGDKIVYYIQETHENLWGIRRDLEALDSIDFSHPSCYRAYSLIKQDIEESAIMANRKLDNLALTIPCNELGTVKAIIRREPKTTHRPIALSEEGRGVMAPRLFCINVTFP